MNDERNIETALSLFKIALGVTHTVRDTYFRNLLRARLCELENTGIAIDTESPEDNMLLADYCEWTYKNRDTAKAMPENLRVRLNNKKVKGRATT